MLAQYELVETIGSPDVVGSATGLTFEPPQPFTAVSSLTAIHLTNHMCGSINDDGSNDGGGSGAVVMRVHAAGGVSAAAAAKKSRMQRKRKLVRTRLNDIARSRNWRHCRKILFLLGVVGVALLASFVVLRVVSTEEFNVVIEWIQTHEVVGSLIYVLTFTLFIIFCFPSTAFELLAGYVFGFWVGLLLATVGKLLGSLLSFVIGRYLCRKRVRAYMERGHPVFAAFQSLLRKRQVLIVFLTRIAFFPIAIKNYGLSVLEVQFTVYAAAALLTGLPFSVIWVYSGHAAQHLTVLLANRSGHSSTEVVVLIVGAASALLLLAFIGYYTRKHILALAAQESAEAAAATAAAGDTGGSSTESELAHASVV